MKTNLLLLLFFLSTLGISAQDEAKSSIKWGVIFSADQTQMQYTPADWALSGENGIKQIQAETKLGYSIGLVLDWQLNARSSFRITPLIARQHNKLIFTAENNSQQDFKIQPLSIGVPIHYVFSPRGKDRVPYFFFGPRFHQTLSKKIDPMVFSITSFDVSGEIGIGLNINYSSLSIAPQLSFSQGFTDLKQVGESGLYNNAIRSMWRSRLSLGVVITR